MKSKIGNLNAIVSWLFVLLGFSIPISTALTNLLLGLITLFWILDNGKDWFRKWGLVLKSNRVGFMGLIVFLIHVIWIFHSTAGREYILESLSDGMKFLFIPMAMIYFKDSAFRSAGLFSFVIAMFITLTLSYLLWLDKLPEIIPVKGRPGNCYIFHDYIKQNIFMAYTAFIAAVWAGSSCIASGKRFLWGLFSFLAIFNVLFMVAGRTGHLVMVVLLLYFLVAFRNVKTFIAVGLTVCFLGGFAVLNPSNPLFSRAKNVIEEAKTWTYGKAKKKSSAANRMDFYVNSLKIIKENPVIGTGTGSFKDTYSRFVAKIGMKTTDNPHNEYLMTAVQFGLAGLLVLLGFFAVQWRQAFFLKDRRQMFMARGFVLLMLVACMTASPLQDNAEGWFFVFMSGLLFAGLNNRCAAEGKVKERHI
jgi:O-antigen ligase